jgi:Domain of unknown function (DUF202)
MSISSSLPKVVRTLSQMREKRTVPSPHHDGGSVPAPPPTPEHSNNRSVPEAEDSNADGVHVEADPSPVLDPNSRVGLRHDLRSFDGGLDNEGGASLLAKLNPALVLQNSGSVARDHLASERTFLAYVRTSLTIATTGVGK